MHRFFLGKFRINGFIIVFTFLWSIDVMVNMLGNIPFMISFMISRKQAESEQYIQYMYMYMVSLINLNYNYNHALVAGCYGN